MNFEVRLTGRAETDIDGILSYIGERSPQGAATWATKLEQVLDSLRDSAQRAPVAPENVDHDEEIRHEIFRTRRGLNYRLIFVIRGATVFVTHVRGPGQDLVSPDELRRQLPERH